MELVSNEFQLEPVQDYGGSVKPTGPEEPMMDGLMRGQASTYGTDPWTGCGGKNKNKKH